METPTKDTIESRLNAAILCFLANDLHLLEIRASERAMCHKLAEYIQQLFRSWHVDCEYNRADKVPKKLLKVKDSTESRSVFPDIIVHRRGTTENCLVLEAKCCDIGKAQEELDRNKLELYLNEINYHYGVFVTFVIKEPYNVKYEIILKG
jgi:hypothetical protein